jgi:hypothetical protein
MEMAGHLFARSTTRRNCRMSSTRFWLLLAIAAVLTGAGRAQAQGFYSRTAQKNPLSGRQEIVDLQRPRWSGEGKGGIAFNPAIGAMQMAAVGRNRFTGRLEYYNLYMNPWTGAIQSTATQFNPFSRRYESQFVLQPPPPRPAPLASADDVAAAAPKIKTKRRVRVIDTKLDVDAPPPAVAPGATLPEVTPGGAQPPQEQASSRTIEWDKDHPEATLNIKHVPSEL